MNPIAKNGSQKLFSYEGNLTKDGAPAGSLLSFTKTWVAPKSSRNVNPQVGYCCFILPLEGNAQIVKGKATECFSNSFVVTPTCSEPVVIANPDASKRISYLTIEVATERQNVVEKGNYQTIGFEKWQPFTVHIGRLGDQVEALLKLKEKSNVFFFAIHGAVEVEDRLLAAGDSLYLKNCSQIKTESFDKNCVLLVLEEKR